MEDALFQRMPVAARLRVTGEDAATFLQGQFSNDLRRSEPAPATYGLWLNHKGRALADSHVLQAGTQVFEVVSRTAPAAAIRERLEAYIIADDVVVEDLTAGSEGLVIAGEGASRVLAALGLSIPEARQFFRAEGTLVIPARVDVRPSWLILAAGEAIAGHVAALHDLGVRPAGPGELERLRVAAGIPLVPDELGADDLPNEGGLDEDAISYTKGCYLGQEVMARLHNLGQVRRRLVIVHVEGGIPAEPRAALFLGGHKVGELRSVVQDATGGAIGFAMVSTQLVKLGALLSLAPDGRAGVRVERFAEGRAP